MDYVTPHQHLKGTYQRPLESSGTPLNNFSITLMLGDEAPQRSVKGNCFLVALVLNDDGITKECEQISYCRCIVYMANTHLEYRVPRLSNITSNECMSDVDKVSKSVFQSNCKSLTSLIRRINVNPFHKSWVVASFP